MNSDRDMNQGARRSHPDMHDFIAALERMGQLRSVDVPINKNTQVMSARLMEPALRWLETPRHDRTQLPNRVDKQNNGAGGRT